LTFNETIKIDDSKWRFTYKEKQKST